MSYPQNRIFTPIRNEPLTGRNANIQPMMYKKKQIFEKVSVERFQTPFSGYSFTGSSISESNILSRSQVSDYSQENVIKLIKEEMQRNGLNTTNQTSEQNLRNKNELNILRIEVKSIKESYHELNKSIKRKLDQQNQFIGFFKKQLEGQKKCEYITKQQLIPLINEKIKQLQKDMAGKTRQVFNKTQQDLRKQVMNYVNRQCIPRGFLDDLDKQLSDIDNRIAHIEGEYEFSNNKNMQNSQSIRIDKQSSVILSSGSELKVNKLERDFQNMRKILDEKSQKIKQLDQLIQMSRQNQLRQFKQIKQLINELNSDIKRQIKNNKQLINTKIQGQKKSFTQRIQSQIQILLKKIEQQSLIKQICTSNINGNVKNVNKFERDQQKSEINHNISKVSELIKKFQNLPEHIVSQAESLLKVSEFEKQSTIKKNVDKVIVKFRGTGMATEKTKNDNLAMSNVEEFSSENYMRKKQQNQTNLTQSKNMNGSLVRSQSSQLNQQQPECQKPKKIYKIDKNGYLMDFENKYLLSSSNTMIKISDQQITNMEKTNLIKVQRWVQEFKERTI